MSLGGVKAPKDPLKKSKGFYVYKDLKIEATERADGRRTREIYLDCGRLKNAVEIVAGITDDCLGKAIGNMIFGNGEGGTLHQIGGIHRRRMGGKFTENECEVPLRAVFANATVDAVGGEPLCGTDAAGNQFHIDRSYYHRFSPVVSSRPSMIFIF